MTGTAQPVAILDAVCCVQFCAAGKDDPLPAAVPPSDSNPEPEPSQAAENLFAAARQRATGLTAAGCPDDLTS